MVHTRGGNGANGQQNPPVNNLAATVQNMARMMDQIQRQNQQLQQQNQDLQRQMQNIQQERSRGVNTEDLGEAVSPFVDAIVNTPFPEDFKIPSVETYDGTADPKEHITIFRTQMVIHGATDPLLCKAFPGTLKKSAYMWFANLPQKSISSFSELAKKFLTQFAACRAVKKRSAFLFNIRQYPKESLKEFLARFNEAAVQVPNLNPEVCLNAFENGLRAGPFSDALARDPAVNMEEVLARAGGFINAEEVNAGKRKREMMQPEPRRDNKELTNTGRPRLDHQSSAKKPEWNSRNLDNFTPLNTKRSQILREVCMSNLLNFPRPSVYTPREGDNGEWCEFHKGPGHSTEECHSLKRQIELLVRQGHLDQYVARQNRPVNSGLPRTYQNRASNRNNNRGVRQEGNSDNNQEGIRGTIHTISGGFAGGGVSSSARKRYVREVMNVQTARHGNVKNPPITFTDEDYEGIDPHQDDPMVVSVVVMGFVLKRVLVDQGSSADILYKDAFLKMGLTDEILKPFDRNLVGFTGDQVVVRGYVEAKVTFGESGMSKEVMVKFMVIDAPSPYNAIIGRSALNALGAVVSTSHLTMKFPIDGSKVGVLKADQKSARLCYRDSLTPSQWKRGAKDKESCNVQFVELDPREDQLDRHLQPAEQLKSIKIGKEDAQVVKIGSLLSEQVEQQLIQLLRENKDVFAWKPSDMPGIDPSFLCHKLALDVTVRPVAQKKRKVGEERRKAIMEETNKLLEAGFIREVKYTTWLSNVVMVKKSNGKWRMCTDFTDLNKACPKDAYPLPSIDRLVDGASGHEILSFMDAYSGYNQIRMHPLDEEKTAFITERSNFCYRVMPFGLKNAGATYQRLMDRVFADQIGRNMEVYVDDMVIKSQKQVDHQVDLKEIFGQLRRYNMRLNPEKCAFGVQSGKFLGFMLTNRGIEANPDKCQAIINMKSPASVREVQQLTGRAAALARFLSKSADRSFPFFQCLRKNDRFQWTDECERAFQELKVFLSSPPVLIRPVLGKPLLLYLSVTNWAISSVLVQELDGEQKPIYFISRVLNGAESRYQKIEKLAFAVVITARKLRPYFQSHQIIVKTDRPVNKILQRPDLAGRMVSWAVELSEYGIQFEARGPLKAQVLSDFVVELTTSDSEQEDQRWYLSVDGASNIKGSGAGVILEGACGILIEQSVKFNFKASNNQAEYEALLAGLRLAQEVGVKDLQVRSDSQLVNGQFSGNYQVKDTLLSRYLSIVKALAAKFDKFELIFVPREQNTRADLLSKLASTKKPGLNQTVIQETLEKPSIEVDEVMFVEEELASWMGPIIQYLKDGSLPSNQGDASRIRRNTARYTIIGDRLYKRGFSLPLLRCLTTSQANRVMEEIHEGVCGSHIGGRSLAMKVLRAGYFWPTLQQDCMDYVKRCDKCQRFSQCHHSPAEDLHSISSPWPFYLWGVDVLGPFPIARAQCKFLLVAIDYFTKWVEVDAVARITADKVKKFYWKKLLCRYGVPGVIISDNGLQFTDRKVKEWCASLGIRQVFSSVEHPQTNGQVEAANKIILTGLKKRLDQAKGRWVDELPQVLWSYHTTPQSSTQETPFRMVYGTDAMIPIEVQEPSYRMQAMEIQSNDEGLLGNLDMIQEVREKAQLRECAAKERAVRKYHSKVVPRSFVEGDLVLKYNKDVANKLMPKWEGPYRVKQVVGKGAYRLEELNGRSVPRTWNAVKLRFYYS